MNPSFMLQYEKRLAQDWLAWQAVYSVSDRSQADG